MAAAQSRIAEIRAQIAALAPTPRAVPSATFNSALAGAFQESPLANANWTDLASEAPVQPPVELETFGNGRIPVDMLVAVGDGSERLYGAAAEAFRRMTAHAWRSGVDLRVNDGYRNLADQERLARELGLYRDGGAAAVPGTSTHGWGISVDVDSDGGAHDWLRTNAARFGFIDDVRGEPWHWTYRPSSSSG